MRSGMLSLSACCTIFLRLQFMAFAVRLNWEQPAYLAQ